jgi:hypothetical protein
MAKVKKVKESEADKAQKLVKLELYKKFITDWHSYFKENFDRFNKLKTFAYVTTLTDAQRKKLGVLQKPDIESNICEPYISRQLGEFAKQEPSFSVSAMDGQPINPQEIDLAEGYTRHEVFEANKTGCEYLLFKDTYGGGFSVAKMWTEYAGPRSFNKVLKFGKVFNPCLTAFDILARNPTKNDGWGTAELYPKRLEELESEYPDMDFSDVTYNDELGDFKFAYKSNTDEKIIMVCEFYEKVKETQTIYNVVGHGAKTKEEYDAIKKQYRESFRQAPGIIGQPREAECDKIYRHIFIKNKFIEYKEETVFNDHPIIFFDGNSEIIEKGGQSTQVTRPAIYNLQGVQNLKNYALQTLASELENLVTHKWIYSEQSLPDQDEYVQALTNNQVPTVVLWNEYVDNNPDLRTSPPQPVVRPPIPPEIMATIAMCDQLAQIIMGTHDAAEGINDNQQSGKAMAYGITQSNSCAMPYLTNFLHGWSQIGQMYVDTIPSLNPPEVKRGISIIGKDGKKKQVTINDGTNNITYKPGDLKVKVEASVNFSIQKSMTLHLITSIMQASEAFNQFINSECLEELIDNMEMRGADQMKLKAEKWMKKLQQQQAQQAQMQQQAQQFQMMNNPIIVKQKELQLKQQQMMADNQIENRKQDIAQQGVDNERMDINQKALNAHNDQLVQLEKSNTEKIRAATELALSHVDGQHRRGIEILQEGRAHRDQEHQHAKDALEFAHTVASSQQEQQQPAGDNANG